MFRLQISQSDTPQIREDKLLDYPLVQVPGGCLSRGFDANKPLRKELVQSLQGACKRFPSIDLPKGLLDPFVAFPLCFAGVAQSMTINAQLFAPGVFLALVDRAFLITSSLRHLFRSARISLMVCLVNICVLCSSVCYLGKLGSQILKTD